MKNKTINLSYFFYFTVFIWALSFFVTKIPQDKVMQALSFFYIFNLSASILLTVFLLGANKAKLNHQLGERKHTSKWSAFIIHIVLDSFLLASMMKVEDSNYRTALIYFSIASIVVSVLNKVLFELIKKRA